jgi:ribosomal protein L37AE/L43A
MDVPAPLQVKSYEGPSCPRCHARLTADWIHSGTVICPDCNKPFEATAFRPPQRKVEVLSVAAALTPEGANACANHARNAAVTNCVRCGLFICALCNMDVGTGPHCPSCFDRLRADDALSPAATRYRDYVSMARVSVLASYFFLMVFGVGILFAALSLFYARKGFKQRRDEGLSIAGLVVIVVFDVLAILGGLAFLALMIVGLTKVRK